MTLNAAIESVLPELRHEAEGLMADTCRITRPGEGDPVWNPGTGSYDPPPPVTVYEGKCRIPPRGQSATSATSAGDTWQVGEYPLDLPVESADYVEDPKPGHTVTYLTSPTNPALVGNVYGITEAEDASQATVRRFKMKRTTGS